MSHLLGVVVSIARVPAHSVVVVLCIVLLSALLPAAAIAAPGSRSAPESKSKQYVVTLAVAGAGKAISLSSKKGRARSKLRAERTQKATRRLEATHGFKADLRYDHALSGFAATLSRGQVRKLQRDGKVAAVQKVRTFRLSGEIVPIGIKRVKAAPSGGPGPDLDVDVAVLDTGIGPVGNNELNIAGGTNCYIGPGQTEPVDRDDWADVLGHGTHVAGTIGARDNSVGTVGVAPGARLWSVRVFDGIYGNTASVLCGLDWAVGTKLDPLQPDIEVINMSFEGPRDSQIENCDPNDPDSIHVAVCAAHQAGITMVAAAGNFHVNADTVSPGGYPQVITVGALSDFDGKGGSKKASNCTNYKSEIDDTYARYSNYGRDVDIIAPGTCVRSTVPNASSGDITTKMTGTSMATPHVTGAVAHYLAGHADPGPDRMRELVRAGGRLDWEPKSDPVWSGVNDSDAPNRVLDVAALTGPKKVRTWVYHENLKVAGSTTQVSTRVDVQRGGGLAGKLTLSLSGLPTSVANAQFEEASLSGLSALGTRLRITPKANGADGRYDLVVKASGSGVAPSTDALLLKVDRTGPRATGLAPRIRGSRTVIGDGRSTQTYLRWNTSDALSNVAFSKLQRKTGTGAWRYAGTRTSVGTLVKLKPGQTNKFRVKAEDSLGNRSTSPAISARLAVRDSKSSKWHRPAGGAWTTKARAGALGGSILRAQGKTASVTIDASGKSVALVAPIGPNRGTMRVRIDGGSWRKVSLRAKHNADRRVVWSRRISSGKHVVQVQGVSGKSAIDALFVIE